jgi:hypothetical protein
MAEMEKFLEQAEEEEERRRLREQRLASREVRLAPLPYVLLSFLSFSHPSCSLLPFGVMHVL